MPTAASTRYSFAADEHLFVELAEDMSLEANFRSMAICRELSERALDGITEICPANASYLVRYDPDRIAPQKLREILEDIDRQVGGATQIVADCTIFDVPVLYDDPWTRDCMTKFRDRHQDPLATDLEYAARVNGLPSVKAFIDAHSAAPWFVSGVAFVAGVPFLFQMTPRERQLEVPKYLRPRTDTPALTIGHGGCFSCIYAVPGAGGYQMFGITPAPILDPSRTLPDFKHSMILLNPGDILRFRAIERAEYDALRAQVEAGTFTFTSRRVRFSLADYLVDPDASNARLVEALDGGQDRGA
jgi:urea carboxylase